MRSNNESMIAPSGTSPARESCDPTTKARSRRAERPRRVTRDQPVRRQGDPDWVDLVLASGAGLTVAPSVWSPANKALHRVRKGSQRERLCHDLNTFAQQY